MQNAVALDLEGVLIPEIWIAIADRAGLPALRRTTRDEPNFDQLMRDRIALLTTHNITLTQIQEIIDDLEPLPGAREFLDTLRERFPVIILSDTFEQLAQPLMRQLGWPPLLCHQLVIENDRVTNYRLRIDDQKRRAVEALQSLNYHVIAAGDSFNDTAMLTQADRGILFRASDIVIERFPQFARIASYDELKAAIFA